MADKVIFDGLAKTITIKSLDNSGDPVTEIDVLIDLYMAWTDWVLYEEGHKWLPAFKPSGREPTNAAETQFTPSYIFIINGWSIVGNSGRNIQIQTNLYPDPDGTTTAASMFVTSNNTNISNRQSDAPIVASELEKALEYGGVVYVNANVTESGQVYPYGTTAQPVNTMADAIAVAAQYGIQTFHVVGTIYITEDCDTFTVIGGAGETIVIFDGNYTLHDGVFKKCTIQGDLNGSYDLIFTGCHFDDGLQEVSGFVYQTGFRGSFSIKEDSNVTFVDCYSEIGGNESPILLMPNNVNSVNNVSIRNYKGGMKIRNFVSPHMIATIEYASGKCNIDDSNTDGFISVRGIPYSALIDNSDGTSVGS